MPARSRKSLCLPRNITPTTYKGLSGLKRELSNIMFMTLRGPPQEGEIRHDPYCHAE
ncbi:hypothetical protein GCM10007159_39520 [Modicisalibacter luteus]|nr:hypothetical protein GCM10007159_39520 [Halomonas lutea]